MTYNPRWPHTFTVVTEFLDENGIPITDENGVPVTDENGVPITDAGDLPTPDDDSASGGMEMERIVYDDNYNPRRNADGSFITEKVTEMPWGYRTATGGLKTAGEVIVADYKISAPMMLTELPTGTVLMLTDYTHTFRVKILKMTTYNWGTNIWVDNIKN